MPRPSLRRVVATTLLSVWVPVANAIGAVDCVVDTPNGRIVGHRSSIQPNVCEFLGIPYAAAPIGSLRFAPPEVTYLTGNISADRWVS